MTLEQMKITKEAKQALLNEKLVGETYSETMLRIIEAFNKNKVEPKPDIFKDF